MIVWLNGTFGAGKTTTSRLLRDALPARVFDAEHIGFLLRGIIGDLPVSDFQDWPPWRGLTVATAHQVLAHAGGTLVIPQTVLRREYWSELMTDFAAHGVTVHAYTLHANRDTFTDRVERDTDEPTAKQWRLDHREAYESALRDWLAAASTVIDNTHLSPAAVAERIKSDIVSRSAPERRPHQVRSPENP